MSKEEVPTTGCVGIVRSSSVQGALIAVCLGLGALQAWGQCDEEQELTASDAEDYDALGWSVSISAETIVVGSIGDDDGGNLSGSAYVFVRSGGAWTQQQKLIAADAAQDDRFGVSVSLSGDTAAVGSRYDDNAGGGDAGSVYVFTRSDGVWTQQQKLTASDADQFDEFGNSVSVSGDTLVVGAYAAGSGGAAYVFVRSAGVWTEQQRLSGSDTAAGDYFGDSVSVSGDTIVVGADFDDDACPGILNCNSGSAYVFVRSGGVWTQQQKLTAGDAAADDRFGISVSLFGETTVVGAYFDDDAGFQSGSAYVFIRSNGVWTQQQKLTATDGALNDQFGFSLSLSGNTVVVGARYNNRAGGSDAGAAYVFVRSGATWTQQQKLIASDATGIDEFGTSVSVDGDRLVVGADNADTAGTRAGSAYVFSCPCSVKADCADMNIPSGVRDDNCVYWKCISGVCVGPVDQVFGDIGSSGGSCTRDGSADNNDAYHAVNCFTNTNFGMSGAYPCDDALHPMNADVGGPGLTCCPDGACDNNDRFLALLAFGAGGGPAGPHDCGCPLQGLAHSCPPANATAPYAPRFTDQATLTAVASTRTAKAGDLVSVDVFMENAVNGLQGYQLHLGVSGGKHGSFELVDITIADRADFVYSGLPFVDAYNVRTHQMLADHDQGAVATKANAYLATFTYRVSAAAAGTFVIDVLNHSTDKKENRTLLFGPISEGMVELVGTKPAVIVVTGSR